MTLDYVNGPNRNTCLLKTEEKGLIVNEAGVDRYRLLNSTTQTSVPTIGNQFLHFESWDAKLRERCEELLPQS